MLLLALIAPAAGAAGVNQGSSDSNVSINYSGVLDFVTPSNQPVINLVSVATAPQDSGGFSTYGLYIGTSTFNNNIYALYALAAGIGDVPYSAAFYYDTQSRPHVLFMTNASTAGTSLRVYTYRTSTSGGTNFSLDSTTGYYLADTLLSGYGGYAAPSDASFFSSYSDAVDAIVNGVSSGAVLISAGDDYEWCTGYELTNSGSSDIAGGWVNDKFYVATYTPNYRISNSTVSVNFSLYDTSTELYYSMVQLIGDPSDELGPQFDTVAEFFASVVTVLDSSSGGGSSVAGQPGTFVLPPGYVGYLHLVDPTVSITVKTTMNRWSNIGGAWYGNQTYLSGTTLPYGSRELPSSGSTLISWDKDPSGQTNLLGQTKAAIKTFTGSSNLIEVYNPYYQDAGGNSEDGNTAQATINGTIYGSTTGIMSWVMYPVEDNMSASNFSGITSDTDGSQFFVGQNDGNNNFNSFTNQNGEQQAPPEGGNNAPPQGNGINDILNNFFQGIFGLFTEGHNAIRNLTQQGSEFVSHLSELYSWLPPQVLSVLTSAIVLAIVIGVLKVFL